MKVALITYTPHPEKIVAVAAKLCYSNLGSIDELMNDMTNDKISKFIKHLSNMGHQSPLEHVSFTFAIEGVSRSLLAQITRHRIASYSVQSQRYVSMDSFDYVIPPEIKKIDGGEVMFLNSMRKQVETYTKLKQGLMKKDEEAGMIHTKAEKKANEDARFVLPNACCTRMILTMNARSLLHLFELRCCARAQWEIRELAEEMLKLVYQVAPNLFSDAGPSCVSDGICPEGSMTCGKCEEMRNKYNELKNAQLVD